MSFPPSPASPATTGTLSMSSPPTQACPEPHIDYQAPAADAAGRRPNDSRRKDKKWYLEAAELMVKLEVLDKMFKELVRAEVGTVTIEAEMMRWIHEREAGPTGHRLLAMKRKCDQQKEKEQELGDRDERTVTQCWREPKVVRRLLTLRKRVVSTRLALARKALTGEMRAVAAMSSKQQTAAAWEEVRVKRRETWDELHPQHQRKVAHLMKRAHNCEKHRMCRKLDNIWKKKNLSWPGDEIGEDIVDSNVASEDMEESEPNQENDSAPTTTEMDDQVVDTSLVRELEEWVEKLVSIKSEKVEDIFNTSNLSQDLQVGEQQIGQQQVTLNHVRDSILAKDEEEEECNSTTQPTTATTPTTTTPARPSLSTPSTPPPQPTTTNVDPPLDTASPAALATPVMATLLGTGPGAAVGAVSREIQQHITPQPPTTTNMVPLLATADPAALATPVMATLLGAGPGAAREAVSGEVPEDPQHNNTTPQTPLTTGEPGDMLHRPFRTREEDLLKLETESEEILLRVLNYNKQLTARLVAPSSGEVPVSEEDNESDVVVCDDLVLSNAELDLLSPGLKYMVVSPLSMQEMKVESVAYPDKNQVGPSESWN